MPHRRSILRAGSIVTAAAVPGTVTESSQFDPDIEVLVAETQSLHNATADFDSGPWGPARSVVAWLQTALANAGLTPDLRIHREPIAIPDSVSPLHQWEGLVTSHPDVYASDANLLLTDNHPMDRGGQAECVCREGVAAVSHWGDRLPYGRPGVPLAEEVSWLRSAYAKQVAVHEVGHVLGLDHSIGVGYRSDGALFPDGAVVATPMIGLYLLDTDNATPDISAEEVQNGNERLFLRSTFSTGARRALQDTYG